jgi:hypothetical protein
VLLRAIERWSTSKLLNNLRSGSLLVRIESTVGVPSDGGMAACFACSNGPTDASVFDQKCGTTNSLFKLRHG